MPLPASMIGLAQTLRDLPVEELPAMRQGFAEVAADVSAPQQQRAFARVMRSTIDAMARGADPLVTLQHFDALLNHRN